MGNATPPNTPATDAAHGARDINDAFRGGGRSVEFLDQINKASIVMLAETGIVPREVAARIARGIAQVIEQERVSGPRRSADYLDYEPRLTAVVGADASRLHSGRSRQDIASAIARMNLRDGLLRVSEALVSAREKRQGEGEPERLGGVEIDDQFELGGLLHGKVGGFRTSQYPVDVSCRTPELRLHVRAVGHEAARLGCFSAGINRGQSAALRMLDDQLLMANEDRVPQNEQSIDFRLCYRRERTIDLVRRLHAEGSQLQL